MGVNQPRNIHSTYLEIKRRFPEKSDHGGLTYTGNWLPPPRRQYIVITMSLFHHFQSLNPFIHVRVTVLLESYVHWETSNGTLSNPCLIISRYLPTQDSLVLTLVEATEISELDCSCFELLLFSSFLLWSEQQIDSSTDSMQSVWNDAPHLVTRPWVKTVQSFGFSCKNFR